MTAQVQTKVFWTTQIIQSRRDIPKECQVSKLKVAQAHPGHLQPSLSVEAAHYMT